ncbi:MAG: NIL domain-containing protein [Planctomycetes bacterium]|nr:NIL domain-containing protein [Planctomycetota bacterium]
MAKKKVLLTFPQTLVKEPIVWQLGRDFNVVTNIRGASISDDLAILAILLEGPPEAIEAALSWLGTRNVKVENLEGE